MYHDQVGRAEESAHAGGSDQRAQRCRLAPPDRQAGQAEQAGERGGVGDHLGGWSVEVVEARHKDRLQHRHVGGPDRSPHDGADAAAAGQPLARIARRPVDAEEAHAAGAGIAEPDAEIYQGRGVGLVIDLQQGHRASRQFEIETRRRGGEPPLGWSDALQREDRSAERERHVSPPDRTGC